MKKWTILIFLISLIGFTACSNLEKENKNITNKRKDNNEANWILPLSLISYGVLARNSEFVRDIDHGIKDGSQNYFSTNTKGDDFLAAVPTLSIFGTHFLSDAKSKHNFRDKMIVTSMALLIQGRTVPFVKHRTKVMRPDNSARTSFPSGHSAIAFTGAHILYKEYKDTEPLIPTLGYVAAGMTGAFRITNNRHWFSDVVTGAGIGILSVELSYMLLPGIKDFFGLEDEDLTITPIVGKSFGMSIDYKLD